MYVICMSTSESTNMLLFAFSFGFMHLMKCSSHGCDFSVFFPVIADSASSSIRSFICTENFFHIVFPRLAPSS